MPLIHACSLPFDLCEMLHACFFIVTSVALQFSLPPIIPLENLQFIPVILVRLTTPMFCLCLLACSSILNQEKDANCKCICFIEPYECFCLTCRVFKNTLSWWCRERRFWVLVILCRFPVRPKPEKRMNSLNHAGGDVCLVVSVSGSPEGGGVDDESECYLIKDAEP